MNRAEAAAILSVDPEASPEDARRAYQELFTEHQVRLTNAPTPALRSLYQARLLELDEAKDVLLATSLGDADSDLPTDQPSIPSHINKEAPTPPPHTPPAPRQEERSAPTKSQPVQAENSRDKRESADIQPPQKKKSKAKIFFSLLAGLVVIVIAANVVPDMLGNRGGSTQTASDTTYRAVLPGLRENLTVARVEFGRGDYDAANRALLNADSAYYDIITHASEDTAVSNIRAQLDSVKEKVIRACAALKRVAERHPGEPTCKTF